MPVSVRTVRKANIPASELSNAGKTRELIREEMDAVNSYTTLAEQTSDPNAKRVYNDIANEEKVHAGELEELLDSQDADNDDKSEEGEEEAEGMIKTVTDMTADEAWADFKSQYDKVDKSRGASDTSLDAKLDTIAAGVNEMKTDVDRLTEVIPQVAGQEAEEDLKAEDDPESELGDDAGIEDFDGEEMDVPEKGAEVQDANAGEDTAVDDEVEEGDIEGGIAYDDSDTGGVSDETSDETSDGDADTADVSDGNDDADNVTDDTSDGEDTEEYFTDDEIDDEGDTEEDKLGNKDVEKMASALIKMNALIKMQGRQIMALQEQMKEQMTVQTIRKSVESRPAPIRKCVGTVSRPPIGTSFMPNGIPGVADEDAAPVIGKATPQEVFAYCQRKAKQF